MSEDNQNITVIILTYGSRRFVYKILEFLNLKKDVKDIVVVSNGRNFEEPLLRPNFHIINNAKNTGSAAGYSQGLERAKKIDNRYVWLLDDDNMPEENALEELLRLWRENDFSNRSHPVALQCFRTSQFAYKNIFKNKELNLLPLENSFMCFHVNKLPAILLNKLRREKFPHKRIEKSIYPSNAGFYGGFFMEMKTLFLIPPPNTDYFVYVDDIEFTNSIKRLGGEIFIALESVVNDLDFSWEIESKKKFLYHPVLDFSTNMKAFHYTKNIFDFTVRRRISNRTMYNFNRVIFSLIIRVFANLRGKNYRLKVIKSAIRSAELLYASKNGS